MLPHSIEVRAPDTPEPYYESITQRGSKRPVVKPAAFGASVRL